jgi:5-oxoprolinase (ATP-hydrolysing) subunit A
MTSIDLNADIGEGISTDQELITLVSSVNISCGAHAGSEADIAAAIQGAQQSGIAIGAHPSYPDRDHSGRRTLDISWAALQESLLTQLHYLGDMVSRYGAHLQHIKFHGALYNDAARNPELADALCAWISSFDASLSLVGLAGGQQQLAARRHGMQFIAEAFVDRAYLPDGTLVPRSQPGAVLHNADHAIAQALSIVRDQQLKANDGQIITVQADSLCIHGDTPDALVFARALRDALEAADIAVKPIARR